jgi:probable F420-dependent oxidoreductase
MEFGLSIAFSDPAHYIPLARAAEENGFGAVTLADHLIYPSTFSVPYPYTPDGVPRFGELDPFPDPWVAISAMAAATQRIKFYTNVFVLPARNPFHVAKILGTAAIFSNYRIALGIGMGWMPEEFAAGGQDFKNRGKRADEMIEVMRKLWSGERVEHHGEFYDFDPLRMCPAPERDIPIYVGGFSKPALRRAAHNDGWIADLHTLAELETLCRHVDEHRERAGTLNKPFQKLSFGCIDGSGVDGFRAMRDMGITVATTMPAVMYGRDMKLPLRDNIDCIKRFADDVISRL